MAIDSSCTADFYNSIDAGTLISLIPANIIEHYPDNSSHRSSTIEILRQTRKQVADFWLATPEDQLESTYSSSVGKVHQMLLKSGIKREPLTDSEQDFVGELIAQISRGFDDPKFIHGLLAVMLYCHAYQVPLKYEFVRIPQWFLKEYLEFVFYDPDHFHETGAVDSYYHHLQQLTTSLQIGISRDPNSQFWQDIATFFAQRLNTTFLYCGSENLKDIFTKRADIMEFALRAKGYKIDYAFSELPLNRKKICLGVILNVLAALPESLSTIPVFEFLDRNKFEIILYVLGTIGHPLEQYCETRVDRLVKLPSDLSSQVQTIRADELDIVFFGRSATDTADNYVYLTLHRLGRIQVTYFVSPSTTGMRNMDYYISGSLMEIPQGAQEHYREQLLVLDGPGFCFSFNTEPDTPAVKPDRKSIHVPDESVIFMSGASSFKIIPELRETWAKIIAAVPNSVLVIYPSHSDQYLHNKLSSVFAKYGIKKDRLIILKIRGRSNVKECLKLGDVYLQAYQAPGSISAIEALEVGLPTVIMDGDVMRFRMQAALLRALEIPDLIANSEETYIQLAVALGTNSELRKRKSEQIKQRMQCNPEFLDSRTYSMKMGSLFEQLCKQHLIIE